MASGAEHEAIVDLRGVVRRFGKFTALNGLNMEVPRGVVYGFVGNNGAGKTTTLHAMLGLIPVDAGTLRVLGRETRHAAADLRDRIGFFPERDEPYDWVTVGSLLRFGSLSFPTWDRDLAETMRDRFELSPKKRIKQLSKGMAAKTKLIVAMARHPDLLVLDEPTSGLDPNSRYDLLDTIRAEATERGVTTVFSSHNLDEVERIATHVGVIHRGRMILEASMDSLKSQFTTVRGAEPDAALHPRVAGHADLDGAPAWLIEGQGSPELEAFAAQHPQAELNPASFSEMFRLVTHDVRPAPAPTP